MGAKRVVAGTVLLLVCTVAWAGTFSPPGKTTATGQPVGTAGPDEPIDTTPVDKTAQPPAKAGDKPDKPPATPKPKPKPTMTPAQARRLYDLRYGEQRKKVDATSGKADDVALAAEHVKVARKYADRPRFFQLLCEEAYELAVRDRAGCATAVEAIDLLLEHFPDRKAAYRDKAIRAYELQYRTGRDRQATGERLIDLHLTEALAAAGREDFAAAMASAAKAYGIAGLNQSPRKAEVLAKRKYYLARRDLKRRPEDTKLRLSTVRLCTVDLDDPGMAAALLTDEIDEATRTYVPLAAKAPGEVPEGACVELGYWYLELAKAASQAGKATCLARATTYLQRYLALHEAKDESRIQAELLLDKASKQLGTIRKAMPATARPKPQTEAGKEQWVDLLKGIDISRDTIKGTWRLRNGRLERLGTAYHVDGETPRVVLPVTALESYELEVKFVRISGANKLGVVLAVGQSAVALRLSQWYKGGGTKRAFHGLDRLNSRPAYDNETTFHPGSLSNDKGYTLRVSVLVGGEEAQIKATLNGRKIVSWTGPESSLSLPLSDVLPKVGCLGLVACSPTAFHAVRYREIRTSEAEPIKP